MRRLLALLFVTSAFGCGCGSGLGPCDFPGGSEKGCCPEGQTRDTDGYCCLDEELDEEGVCLGESNFAANESEDVAVESSSGALDIDGGGNADEEDGERRENSTLVRTVERT